jgi:mannosyltransferase
MIKNFDNIIFHLQNHGGGSVYWGELMKRFNQDITSRFIEPNHINNNLISKILNLNSIIYEKKIPISLLRYLPVLIKLESNSIFHSSYYRFSIQKDVTNIVTIHDFIYEKFNTGIKKYVHNKQKYLAISNSKGIICISNNTKTDLIKYFPNSLNKKNIEVIYNGISNEFYKINIFTHFNTKFEILIKYKCLLYIGHRTIYKNFNFVIEILEKLPKDYKLIIVGSGLTNAENSMLNDKLNDKFYFFGNVDNSELNILYNFSHCLIYPSSYEGFGIPIIEAFRCGCPVVAQAIPVLIEISEGNAILINELNVDKFTKSIIELSDNNMRNDLVYPAIELSKKYTWDKCFNQTNNFYNCL